MSNEYSIKKIDDYRWEIPKTGGMRVPGRLYTDEKMLKIIEKDNTPLQVKNVAHLPGIIKYSLAMPDMHWGYGFCLTKDTKVLSNFGFYKKIEDFEKDWQDQRLKCIDLNSQKPTDTPILRFIKLRPNEVFKIVTKGGHEIKATLDHPLFTPFGMKPVKDITPGEKVAIFSFRGVPYEKPSSEIIISEEDVKNTLLKLGRKSGTFKFEIILQKLKERNLLPLTYDHPKLPYILKIMGFVFGDGSMNFIGKRVDGVLHFSGKPEDLEEVRKDLEKIGYTPGSLHYQKRKDSQGSNKYYNCRSFMVNASSLVVLLETLGVPRGSKVNQAYRIPKWIFKAPLWQKRLFLASLFGCELRIPHRRINRRGYFNAPVFSVAKRDELIKNGKEFLKDIAELLKNFGVKSLYIDKRKKHINKKGKISWALELIISPKPENLLNLWGKIGFEYNFERSYIANIAVQYLKLKQKILKEKERAIKEKVPQLLKTGLSYQEIANQLAGNPLTKRFIIDICWKLNKGKKVIPRIPANFPSFNDYLKDVTSGLEKSGMVWDEITKIEKIDYKDFVYDFTVTHPEHNFIAENFVVSNCIGGVAATDPDEAGVISPGGIGYDINCLSGNTEVLHSHGYRIKIKDFEHTWQKEEINCFDFTKDTLNQTPILRFIKRLPHNKVYQIRTATGEKIVATEDHPFYTKDGMVTLKQLKKGQELAIYPFKGVPYEEPNDELILTSEHIKKTLAKLGKSLSGNASQQILKHLCQKGLLPLRYSSPQLPYLLKLMGYIFGDGCIHFVHQNKKGIISFYGIFEDLEQIRKDILTLGFKCSRVYNRKRKHKITTHYATYTFSSRETCCKVISNSLAILLVSLGVPYGKKTRQDYLVPEWIFNAPRWQKRLFLASFFGAKLSTPKNLTPHEHNLYCPVISINKRVEREESGRKFLFQISKLLTEFGIKTCKISSRQEKTTLKGKTVRLRLIISGKDKDLVNLYTSVGFEYNQKRQFLANVAVQFLKEKKKTVEKRKEIAARALQLKQKTNRSASPIFNTINSPTINLRFIERSIYGQRKEDPRTGFKFPIFSNFLKEATEGLGTSGMVWDRIVEKRLINFKDYVYDFTVKHPHHNFIANSFVVSNCGVRLVRTNLEQKDIKPKLKELLATLFTSIPCGVGSTSKLKLSISDLKKVLKEGAKWAISRGYGHSEDLERCEDYGAMQGADPEKVSQTAYKRGHDQLGTLGSGNHFLEIDLVEQVFDPMVAERFGLFPGQIVIIIHSGSRGLGYQICDDYLARMRHAVEKYHISLPDRQLSCAPLNSPEGKDYFAAMAGAANYAWANRQIIMHWTREVFQRVLNLSPRELGMNLVYDVCHNIGKFEEHVINGKKKTIFVHRKGATRAFPAQHPQVPDIYREVGQPVLIPGDMGTNSYVMVGAKKAMEETWGSTCHGAGRVLSRAAAKKAAHGRSPEKELEEKGILIMAKGRGTIAEEMPEAYKDVDRVVDIVEKAGLSKKVVKMRPLAVIKG